VIAVVVFAALVLYEEFESRVLVPLVYGRALRLPSAVVFLSLIVGAGPGRHRRRPAGAAAGRGDCDVDRPTARGSPGETEQPRDAETRRKDEQQEQEYEQRTEQKPAAKAAAIAVEIANERKQEENKPRPPE